MLSKLSNRLYIFHNLFHPCNRSNHCYCLCSRHRLIRVVIFLPNPHPSLSDRIYFTSYPLDFAILILDLAHSAAHSFRREHSKKKDENENKIFCAQIKSYTQSKISVCLFILKANGAPHTHTLSEWKMWSGDESENFTAPFLFLSLHVFVCLYEFRISAVALIYGITNNGTYTHNNIHWATKPNIAINIAGFGNGCSCCFGSTFADRVVWCSRNFQSAGIPVCASECAREKARKKRENVKDCRRRRLSLPPPLLSLFPRFAHWSHIHISHATWIIYNTVFDCLRRKKIPKQRDGGGMGWENESWRRLEDGISAEQDILERWKKEK